MPTFKWVDPSRVPAVSNSSFLGTAGVLVLAKERSLIGSVRPCLDALIAHRSFLSRAIYNLILDRAGESDGFTEGEPESQTGVMQWRVLVCG